MLVGARAWERRDHPTPGALRGTGELHGGQVPGALQIGNLVVTLVQQAGGIHPPQDVQSSVAAGHADVLAHRQGHRPSGVVQFVGDLDAAGGGAHREFTVYSVTVHASYRDTDGTWKRTSSFRGGQLYAVLFCLQRASDWILSRRDPEQREG